jgi:flagellar basal body P-ring protein FlgI
MMPPLFAIARHVFPAPWLIAGMLLLAGCTAPAVRSQSPENEGADAVEPPRTRLVGDVALATGLQYIRVEGVSLATGLAGTGSDPPPTMHRGMLVSDMQARGIEHPDQVLGHPNNSLVLVRGYIPPGAKKGDTFDIEVYVPAGSETSSLRGGWLLETRLQEMAFLGGQFRSGHTQAHAEGPVLVDALVLAGNDKVLESRGRVLGGGVVQKPRALGLTLRPDHQNVRTSAIAAAAINTRFHTYDRGLKRGVATAKRDDFIELLPHPRYRNNLARYFRVVQSVPLRESPGERVQRLTWLERQLREPLTSSVAALRLEALGNEGTSVLYRGLDAPEVEIRFYAAEALAYLNDSRAVPVLGQVARQEPVFRWYAITALGAMDEVAAYDELTELLHVPSAETRYGAFAALKALNPHDPVVRGESLDGKFNYHVISTAGEPMVHVARSRKAELVVFGPQQRLSTPLVIFAGKNILLKSVDGDRLRVTHHAPGQPDREMDCPAKLDDMVRTIVQIGGGYADVVQALHEAKRSKCLSSRLVVDALPRPGRRYRPGPRDADLVESASGDVEIRARDLEGASESPASATREETAPPIGTGPAGPAGIPLEPADDQPSAE